MSEHDSRIEYGTRRRLRHRFLRSFRPSIAVFEDKFLENSNELHHKNSHEHSNHIDAVIDQLKARKLDDEDLADRGNVSKALQNNYSNGDVNKAVDLLLEFRDALEGTLQPITHMIDDQSYYYKIKGSDNYNGVSCYLDSLLFAMFARLRNFEPILFKNFGNDEARENLALFIRLWVNMIRQGKLVTTDITQGLIDAIFSAGWHPSEDRNHQQDAGELFAFITEKLNMPLLTLRVDIAHGGKEDANDDHKLVNESLLHIPIPGSPSDPPLLLEECLELYFANSVQVSRQIERRRTLESIYDIPPTRSRVFSQSSMASLTTQRKYSLHVDTVEGLNIVGHSSDIPVFPDSPRVGGFDRMSLNGEDGHGMGKLDTQMVSSPRTYGSVIGSPLKTYGADLAFPLKSPGSDLGSPPSYNSIYHDRKESSFSLKKGMEITHSPSKSDGTKPKPDELNPLWTSNMEITLPAWMFLQLLPFYTDISDKVDTSEHGTSSPVAVHFANARPILGICLKRYAMTNEGEAVRNDRMVIVPRTIRLPSFVADESTDDNEASAFGNFKLVLESAVFHRGTSLQSGHFVSLTAEDAFIPCEERESKSNYRKKTKTERFFGLRGKKDFDTPLDAGPAISPPVSLPSSPLLFPSDLPNPADRRWIMFDDLEPPEKKVTPVDFETVFSQEVPYLLFYRVVALDENTGKDGTMSDTSSPLDSNASRTPNFGPAKISDIGMCNISPISTLRIGNSKLDGGGIPELVPTGDGAGSISKKSKRIGGEKANKKKTKRIQAEYREEKCQIM